MTQITVRLDDEMDSNIEDEIATDVRFENRSQFVRYCLRLGLASEYEQSE